MSRPFDAYLRPLVPGEAGGVGARPVPGEASSGGGRPWIGVQFVCAGKYVRVFRAADASGYLARCPTCARTMWFRVGSGGTSERFFEVSCR